MVEDPRSGALTALSQFLVTDLSLRDTLQRVATIALDAVPSATVAGISMIGTNGQPTTAICADETSPAIDEAQSSMPRARSWRQRDILKRASQRENVKVREIAQRIVNRERLTQDAVE
jgi:hypothetical protein